MNATDLEQLTADAIENAKFSQFPFWDFVECNIRPPTVDEWIAFMNSQFPFWDFVECNEEVVE